MSKNKQSVSSQRWLKEHFDDKFVQQAQKQGLRSRAGFKIEEIQQKDGLIKSSMTVVDLGAAPGGWSQYVAKVVGDDGLVIACDILPMDPLAGVSFLQGDFREENVLNESLFSGFAKYVFIGSFFDSEKYFYCRFSFIDSIYRKMQMFVKVLCFNALRKQNDDLNVVMI